MSILRKLARVVGLGKEKFYKGLDLEGNAFYEFPSPNGDKTDWRQSKRTVEYAVTRHLSDYRFVSIPVQWNAWLRRTRQFPPSIEELQKDLQRMQRVQTNVERLRLEYIEEKRLLREEEYKLLQNVSAERNTTLLGHEQGEVKAEEEPEVQELTKDSVNVEGMTVGEIERREIELKRRQFAAEQSKKSQEIGNPSDGFRPEAWEPTSAPRRR